MFVTLSLTLVLTASVVVGHTLGTVPMSVDPTSQRLVDEYNREVIFHGVNVVQKVPPYIPQTTGFDPGLSFSKKDMEILQQLGLNTIRLGTMWDGIEATRGVYNESYLAQLRWIVQEAANYGIYSLMDLHQDVMAAKFCGEGFPDWVAVPDNNSQFPWPMAPAYNYSGNDPVIEDCWKLSWSEYYFTKATGSAFQHLYNNDYGLLDSFTQLWRRIAEAVGDLGSAVLGYELMNEPWSGDAVDNLTLMIPGVADRENLQPAWDAGAAAIRTVDTTHAVFFEGVTWDWFNVGFEHVPGGEEWRNKSVLSYHYYAPPDFSLDVQFAARQDDMKRLQCGGMLTESYGGEDVLDKCDATIQSWMIWIYKPFSYGPFDGSGFLFYDNGTMNMATASQWSRTYAQVVAGSTLTAQYNATTKVYVLVFAGNPKVQNNVSNVYFNEMLHYPNGVQVTLSTSLGPQYANWRQTEVNHIEITHDMSMIASANETVTFRLEPL